MGDKNESDADLDRSLAQRGYKVSRFGADGEEVLITNLTFDDVMHPDMTLKDELMMMKALGERQVGIMLKNDRSSYYCEICGYDTYPFGDLINMRGIPGFVHWCTQCHDLFAQGLSPEEIRKRLKG